MQNFTIFRLIGKYWWLILVITAVVFAASWAAYSRHSVSAFGSLSTTVQVSRSYPSTSQLLLQGETTTDAQVMVATTQSWLGDPSTISTILNQAQVAPTDSSLTGLAKVFKVVTPVANTVTYQVQYVGATTEEVTRVFQAMRTVLNKRADEYNQQQVTGIKINLIYSDPFVTSQSSSLPLTPIAGLLGGLIFSLVVVALLDRKNAH